MGFRVVVVRRQPCSSGVEEHRERESCCKWCERNKEVKKGRHDDQQECNKGIYE